MEMNIMCLEHPISLGVIGGTGIYELEGFEIEEEKTMETPFGDPSDSIIIGRLKNTRLAFLTRHGRGHHRIPHEINYRANIYAMKALGISRLLSISAVGSMKEEIQPGDLVVVDQFFDRTRNRNSTFFGNGLAAHVGFGDPVCKELSSLTVRAARGSGANVHPRGTYVCIEGPRFSTRAESEIFRSWGVHIIGMTNLPEAGLAREAELCFCTLALVTDYDCWHEEEADVTVDSVLQTLKQNSQKAKATITSLATLLAESPRFECNCGSSLKGAIMTHPDKIDPNLRKKLAILVDKYLP